MSATGSVELHARRRGAVRNGQAPARREGRRVDLQIHVDQHEQLRSEGNINPPRPRRASAHSLPRSDSVPDRSQRSRRTSADRAPSPSWNRRHSPGSRDARHRDPARRRSWTPPSLTVVRSGWCLSGSLRDEEGNLPRRLRLVFLIGRISRDGELPEARPLAIVGPRQAQPRDSAFQAGPSRQGRSQDAQLISCAAARRSIHAARARPRACHAPGPSDLQR